MNKSVKQALAPTCCGIPARLTTGVEIYPNRPDLSQKRFYKCDRCGGYCGCHAGTTRSLGTPAGPELRRARSMLHDNMIDPIWKSAVASGGYAPENEEAAAKIRSAARGRVYAYLAHRLGIARKVCHTGMFSIEQCRAAWMALRGVSYPEIRAWYKAQPRKDEASAA